MPRIDANRLLQDMATLRSFGARGPGVVRPAFSAEDMAARRWLMAQFSAAGLEASIDGVGNVFGRARQPGPALLIGSHSDTQPTGGWLDGALGVVYALETVRALAMDPATRSLAVDAISLQDEESRFLGCLGSRSLCGLLTPELEADVVDQNGLSLADALRGAGLAGVARTGLESGRHIGFLEAHIEQGPHLDDADNRIGVVTSIVGLRGLRIVFRGQQNHAGTTMMARRQDASTALYAFAHGLNTAFAQIAGPRTVWTMGRARIEPNAPSIVPGYAELDLQFRDESVALLDTLQALAIRRAEDANRDGPVRVETIAARAPIAPTRMDEGLRTHLQGAAQRHAPGKWVDMTSGAFHDAGIVSQCLPSAMLFIPSIGGISHDFAEDSRAEDIVLGCQVLADGAATILQAAHAAAQ